MPGPDDLMALTALHDPVTSPITPDVAPSLDPLRQDDNLGLPDIAAPGPLRLTNPFDLEGKGPRQGMSFSENQSGAFRSNSILGAAVESADMARVRRDPGNSAMDRAWLAAAAVDPTMANTVSSADPWMSNVAPAEATAARDAIAERNFYEQLAYDSNPTRITGPGVAGTIAGVLADPTNLIGVPGRLLSAAGLGARPILRSAVDNAIVAGLTDQAVQGIRMGSGAQEEYDVTQAVAAPVVGGALGAALPVVVEGVKRGVGAASRAVRGRLAGEAPSVRPEVPPPASQEAVQAVEPPSPPPDASIAAAATVVAPAPQPVGVPPQPLPGDLARFETDAQLLGQPIPRMPEHRVATADGGSVDVRPVVVEARDLLTSADSGYDGALQPRQRDRAASQEQIRNIATGLEPERLGFSAEADRGAPIVGSDGMVESGNGRVEAIRRAYEQNGEAAQRYREWLADKGVDVSGYDAPVLVRERVTPMTPEERQAFTVSANRSSTLAMSAPERALADSRLLTPDSLDLIRNANDLGAVANRDFVRSFAAALPQAERGALSTAEGGLSAEGLTRVRNAVLARAYGDAPVLSRITEATSDDIKSISSALTAAAPEWAKMRADIEGGRVRGDVDLTTSLVEAVSRTADLRTQGQKLDAFFAQQDAFDRVPETVEAWMRMFYDPSGRRAAGGPRIAEGLRAYATEARKVTADAGLDLGLEPVRPGDLQRLATDRARGDAGEAPAVLFRRGAGDGQGDAARRSEVRGPGPSRSGSDLGGPGLRGDEAGAAASRAAELADVDAHVRSEGRAIQEELFRKGPVSPHGNELEKGRPLADQGTVPGDTRVGRLEDLAAKFAADFDTILRTGRVTPGAQGTYNTKSGVARVRSLSDLDTVIHEVGHSLHLNPLTKPSIDPIVIRNRGELAAVGAGQGPTGDAEAFAELFRLYVTNRPFAQKTYPKAAAELDRVLRTSMPDQAHALDEMRVSLDAMHRADSGAIVTADVVTPAPDGLFTRIMDVLGLRNVGGADVDPLGRPIYQWRDALYTRFVDPKNPIAKAIEGLGRIYKDSTGKTLDLLPMDDAYIRARLSSGSHATADSILKRGVIPANGTDFVGPSYFDAITTAMGRRWSQQQWHEFGAYLVSRRMVAEYNRFLQGDLPNPPGKFSQADYAKAVGELEAANPGFKDGATQLYEFQTNLLQRRFDKHLFTKGYLDASLVRTDYVPLHRDMSDLGSGQTVNTRSGDAGASLMKAFRGSQRSPLNPLDMIFKSVHDLEFEIAANDTKRAIARLADMAGPGSGAIAEHIPANRLTASHVDVMDALQKAGVRANVDSGDLTALLQHAEMLMGDDVFARIFRQEPIRPGQEPITFYFENGERRALRLADGRFGAELHAALNLMSDLEKNVFLSVLQISQAVLRAAVTKSVGFIYRNFVRDQLTSTATAGRNYIPFYSAMKGGLDVIFQGGDFEKYIGHGGIAGGLINDAIESSAFGHHAQAFRQKSIVDPRRLAHGAAKVIEISEASTRAGLFQSYYRQAQGLGFDDMNSVLYATFKSNDYIDFRKAGSHMGAIRRIVPFLNAAVQGTDREYRALFGDMIKLEGKRWRGEGLSTLEADRLTDARVAWLKTLAAGAALGAGGAYFNAENPEWNQASAWRRNSNYHLLPMGDGRWFVSPKPFGFVRNVSDLFEYATEFAIRRDPTIASKWLKAVGEAHHLPYSNPIVDVFYNVRSNYDAFKEKPIVPTYLQGVEPSEQYDARTSEVAKHIGDATGWSPMKVQYVMRALGGGIAQDFIQGSDALLRQKGPKTATWDLPLLRELSKNLAPGNEIAKSFWDQVRLRTGSLAQAADTYQNKIKAGERIGAAEYLQGLSEDRRAWAVLMTQGFPIEAKMMHPLYATQAHATIISGVTRQLVNNNLVRESDVERGKTILSRRDAKPILVDGSTREKVMSELDALTMAYARNALLVTKAPGLEGVPAVDPSVQLDRIKRLSPEVFAELEARTKTKRIHDLDTVRDRWPEVRARILRDGEKADLKDLLVRRPRSVKTRKARTPTEPQPTPGQNEGDDE
ncbi:LPD38 domain-containing protein [uncultured Enterovirga sp.]|uniref:LPD38 domain-containing protein n=1 Tax=uncultured Enterovirga sp. TaxID=2026352 RepID=UPI0035C99FFE